MKTLEIIHLRLGGERPESLVDMIRECVGVESKSVAVHIYRHSRLATDLIVHLHRDGRDENDGVSGIGHGLATLLREYGMVEHSMWVAVEAAKQPRAERKVIRHDAEYR